MQHEEEHEHDEDEHEDGDDHEKVTTMHTMKTT